MCDGNSRLASDIDKRCRQHLSGYCVPEYADALGYLHEGLVAKL
jgi:hypothetical protein